MSEKWEVPEASESKEDKKALFFLLENAYPLPFSSLPCPLSSPLEFYRIKERENPQGPPASSVVSRGHDYAPRLTSNV